MDLMELKKAKRIRTGLYLGSLICILFLYVTLWLWWGLICVLLLFFAFAFDSIFWKCPYCGESLFRQTGPYCQHCGEKLDF